MDNDAQTAFEAAARADERQIIRRAAWTRLWYVALGLLLAGAFLACFAVGFFVGRRGGVEYGRESWADGAPATGGVWLPLPRGFHARLDAAPTTTPAIKKPAYDPKG